jgi:hypothetical protein
LRAIDSGIKADEKLQQYTGTISFSQISRVNGERKSGLFKSVFDEVFLRLSKEDSGRELPAGWGRLKILDSTLVRLSLSMFSWAKYQKTTAGLKIHTEYDLLLDCPDKIVVSEGIVHDKKKMDEFVTKSGVTYIFDRAYLDYELYDSYCEKGIFFVTRLKSNAVFEVVEERKVRDGGKVLADKTVILGGGDKRMNHKLRIIQVVDSSNGELFYILTNRFDLTAEEIAEIYRLRWSIEIFFKWIKQHLKIKHFYGQNLNAVLIQIYSALILYCLLKIIHLMHCKKFNFLDMVRLIADNPWNTIASLIQLLTPSKTSAGRKRKDSDAFTQDDEFFKEFNSGNNLF